MKRKTVTVSESFSDTVNRIENSTDVDSWIKIKELIEKIELMYFEIGGHLLKTFENRSQNDLSTLPNFGEGMTAKSYIEKEFGYKSHKCRYLASNYGLFVDLLNDWSDLGGMPMVKAKEILPIAKPENLSELIELSKNMSALELKTFVSDNLKPVVEEGERKVVKKTFLMDEGQKVFVDKVLASAKKETGVSGDSSALEAVMLSYAAGDNDLSSLPPLGSLLDMYPINQIKNALSEYIASRKVDSNVQVKTTV